MPLLHPVARFSPSRKGLRPQRINALLRDMRGQNNYLEVGTFLGHTVQVVWASKRVGVDPDNRFNHKRTPSNTSTHQMTSDNYFLSFEDDFNLVFLDGLQEANQTYADLLNAVDRLRPGGLILIDDVRPTDWPSSLPDLLSSVAAKEKACLSHDAWYGSVYKVIQLVIERHQDLGVGIFGNFHGGHGQALGWRRHLERTPRVENSATVFANMDFAQVFGTSEEPLWPSKFSLAEPPLKTLLSSS